MKGLEARVAGAELVPLGWPNGLAGCCVAVDDDENGFDDAPNTGAAAVVCEDPPGWPNGDAAVPGARVAAPPNGFGAAACDEAGEAPNMLDAVVAGDCFRNGFERAGVLVVVDVWPKPANGEDIANEDGA